MTLSTPQLVTRFFFFAIAFLTTTSLARAQSTADLTKEVQNPAPINSIEIDGGYKFNYKSGSRNESFYSISYKGALVRSEGTPFKYASGLDLATPAMTTGSGDRNKLSLRFEKGTTTIGGGLFEAGGVQPLSLRGLEALNLRGTALIGADSNLDNVQFAVGLETPPSRLPPFRNTRASNWLIFGINAQRQEATDSSDQDQNVGLLTYRAFLGKAFGWRKSADVGKAASQIADEFLKQAPTYMAATTLSDKIKLIDANKRTELQQLFLDAFVEAGSEANWKKTVRDITYGNTDAVTDQPTFALYAETSGWYEFAGTLTGSKFKNLITGTFDYWFLPKRDDVFLRLRYENGYERATPTERKDHLLMSLSLRF